MKIAYVLRYFPTLTETFVYREIAELQRRGHTVIVVALGRRPDGVLQDQAPDVAVLEPGRSPLSTARALLSWLRSGCPPTSLSFKHGIRAAALRFEADRLHVHFAGEAAEWALELARGRPVSVTVHAVDLFKPRPRLREILAQCQVFTIAAHHAVYLKRNLGVQARVIRMGVPLDAFPAADPGGDGPLRIISVGRNVPKKGLDTLRVAFEQLEEPATLRLVSEGASGPGLTCGPVPPSEVPALLAAARVFVLPCRIAPDGDRDGIPVAILEAMAAGLPVVTTPIAGIPEVVDTKTGWLVPSDDPDALSDTLREVARSPEERRRRGHAGRKRLEERGYTVRGQVDALVDAWENP